MDNSQKWCYTWQTLQLLSNQGKYNSFFANVRYVNVNYSYFYFFPHSSTPLFKQA